MGKRGRKLPPLTANDLKRVIHADGWRSVPGKDHLAFEHPTKRGKVNIDHKWTGVTPGGWVFRSVLRQAGLTRKRFEELYWTTR
jgi:predicted RNA binding protein YcfA (HicA-like mRNA interferase family)